MICIRQSPGRGRGVFATQAIKTNTLIESCPVIVFENRGLPPTLHEYTFRWNQAAGDVALVLGYGSLYNHSYEPNAFYEREFAKLTMHFVALRSIREGEEITVNYNGDPKCKDSLWFVPT